MGSSTIGMGGQVRIGMQKANNHDTKEQHCFRVYGVPECDIYSLTGFFVRTLQGWDWWEETGTTLLEPLAQNSLTTPHHAFSCSDNNIRVDEIIPQLRFKNLTVSQKTKSPAPRQIKNNFLYYK